MSSLPSCVTLYLQEKCHQHDQELQALKAECARLNQMNRSRMASSSPRTPTGSSMGGNTPISQDSNGVSRSPPSSPQGNGLAVSTLQALQSLATANGSKLFETVEGKALLQTLILALKQGQGTPSSKPPSSPGTCSMGSSSPSTSSTDASDSRLGALLSRNGIDYHEQHSQQASSSNGWDTTSKENHYLSTVTVPHPSSAQHNVQNSPHHVTSTTATADPSLSSQISPPGGDDSGVQSSAPSKKEVKKFDMLRRLLTEYKDKQSRESHSKSELGKPSSPNGHKNGINSPGGSPLNNSGEDLIDDMQLNIDSLLMHLGDLTNIDFSSLNNLDLHDL